MNLFKSSIWIGFSTALKMIAGIVTTKIMAYVVGPAGIALIGNFNNFTSIVSTLSNGALGSGVTKYIAEYDENKDKHIVVAHAMKITLICSSIIGVIVILFSGDLSNLVMKTRSFQSIFIIFGASIFFYGLNVTINSILCGYKEIKYLIISGILSNVLGVVLAIIITLRFGLYGALLNTIIAQIFTFFVYLIFLFIIKPFNIKIIHIKLNKILLGKLFKYTLMSIVSAIAIPLSLMFIRNYVINTYSASDAGILQGMWSISGVYLSVVIMILSTYFMPALSSIKENIKFRKEILNTFKFIIPLAIIGLIVVFILKKQIISILYTDDFLSMQKLFLFHLIGDLFRISAMILEYVLVAKAMARIYIKLALATSISYTVFSIIFVKYFGIIGESYAYCIYNFLYMVVMIFIFRDVLFNKAKNKIIT